MVIERGICIPCAACTRQQRLLPPFTCGTHHPTPAAVCNTRSCRFQIFVCSFIPSGLRHYCLVRTGILFHRAFHLCLPHYSVYYHTVTFLLLHYYNYIGSATPSSPFRLLPATSPFDKHCIPTTTLDSTSFSPYLLGSCLFALFSSCNYYYRYSPSLTNSLRWLNIPLPLPTWCGSGNINNDDRTFSLPPLPVPTYRATRF